MARETMPTVLVVDDNRANRLLVQNTLEDEGYRVEVAETGEQAIARFTDVEPDCVLLDVRMPDTDGLVACERIRALPRGAEVPILFLTAQRDVDTFDRAFRVGGDDFLTKPVQPAELLVRVQTALKVRRLSAELREHYDLVKSQRDALLRAQLAKERLAAFIVHDLKNPVNSMALYAQLLQRSRELPERELAWVVQIHSEARQLGRMIVNLLDLSKADEGKLTPSASELDLRAVVEEILVELRVIAEQHGVELRRALSADRIRADADLLRRVLANIVENAIRHAPEGSQVTLSAERGEGGIEVRISDQGSGIPAALREKIFDAYSQVDASGGAAARGSRGLGLTFCKLAVEAHGGTIWVEDAAPGAVFCLRIPDEA